MRDTCGAMAKGTLAAVLAILSMVLGPLGAGALVASVCLGIGTGPGSYTVAYVAGAWGVVAFAVSIGAMSLARRLGFPLFGGGIGIHMRPLPSWVIRVGLMVVAVLLVYMGASSFFWLVLALLGHAPAFGVAGQVAIGADGVALLALGAGAMRTVRHLQQH